MLGPSVVLITTPGACVYALRCVRKEPRRVLPWLAAGLAAVAGAWLAYVFVVLASLG